MLLIRTSYVVLIPIIVWLIFGWFLNLLYITDKTDAILNRILSTVISVVLFILAIIEATSKNHLGNTQTINTNVGNEDVGDYIELPGPDYGNVFVLVIFATLFLWHGVLRKEPKPFNTK
jgi:hypothetical protein